jgi:predicted Zn finger-like uncharacterized protein
MPIDVRCPACTTRFAVPDRVAGKRIRCKSCGEDFPVEGPVRPAQGEDEAPADRPRKRKGKKKQQEPIPRAVLWSVVGVVLFGVLMIAAVAVVHLMRPRPKLGPGGTGEVVQQTAVFAEHVFRPAKPAKEAGRPLEVREGPVVVTLSNPRRVAGGDRPTYQIDYAFANGPPTDADQLDLVVKVPNGFSELKLPRLAEAKGTLSFTFFPGEDPGQAFELWAERRLPGRGNNRQRVSPVVTFGAAGGQAEPASRPPGG